MANNPRWTSSFKSHIWIFNVGRGLSIFIRTPLNQGIWYDLGSSDKFSPSEFLGKNILPYLTKYKKCGVAQAVISHPHADHISEIESLKKDGEQKEGSQKLFYPCLLTCPHDKTDGSEKPEALDWNRIENPKGSEDKLDMYKAIYSDRKLPLQTIIYDSTRTVPNLEYGLYYVRPPVVDKIYSDDNHAYGNGVSLILYYRHGFHSLLIPGDINPKCIKHILDDDKGTEKRYTIFDKKKCETHPEWSQRNCGQPSLKTILFDHGLSVLIASHHGLESCFSNDLYEAIKNKKPDIVVISEKRHLFDKDGKVDSRYQSEEGAKGLKVNIEGKEETRYSVSTRDGHHMLIEFQGTGGVPQIFLNKDPSVLLKLMH